MDEIIVLFLSIKEYIALALSLVIGEKLHAFIKYLAAVIDHIKH